MTADEKDALSHREKRLSSSPNFSTPFHGESASGRNEYYCNHFLGGFTLTFGVVAAGIRAAAPLVAEVSPEAAAPRGAGRRSDGRMGKDRDLSRAGRRMMGGESQ